uniref:N-terminal amino-acid N(alpha)-acetyltransferase NatA n=1 Tax=Strongyloides venezuelensis TaxID=75913 RepID=A0A0K0FD38_STRVS
MVSIRNARVDDLLGMQHCNQQCLPEHYKINYFSYILLCWPSLSHVAEDDTGKIIGYILVKYEDEIGKEDKKSGHVVSLAVSRSFRRLGIAKKLIYLSCKALVDNYSANQLSLQVRISNSNAIYLYLKRMSFKKDKVLSGYYADGEDAFLLVKDLTNLQQLKLLNKSS